MKQILGIITNYGLETVAIALLINVLTCLVKMPIKFLANKVKDYTKVTRFIVFLPIGLGFLLSFLYVEFIGAGFNFDRIFATMWFTSSGFSLAFYSIFENLFPSKKKILSDCEIKTSEAILANIKQLIEENAHKVPIETTLEKLEVKNVEKESENVQNKIILKGKAKVEVNTVR